jgi:hypothetical protein
MTALSQSNVQILLVPRSERPRPDILPSGLAPAGPLASRGQQVSAPSGKWHYGIVHGGDHYAAGMEDTAQELTFHVQGDPRLSAALVRRLMLRVWCLIALGVLAVAILLVQWQVITTKTALLYGGVALLLLFQVFLFEVPKQTVRQNAHKLGRPTTYRIDSAGIHTTAGFGTDIVPWPAITSVSRTRDQIIIWQGWRKAYGIPSDGLSPAEQDRLLEVLRSRGRALPDGGSPG